MDSKSDVRKEKTIIKTWKVSFDRASKSEFRF